MALACFAPGCHSTAPYVGSSLAGLVLPQCVSTPLSTHHLFPEPEWHPDPIQQGGRGNARDVRVHERAALPPCCTHERGFAAYERFVAAAPPRVLDTRTLISCRWDTGGDGHRRIMATHHQALDQLSVMVASPPCSNCDRGSAAFGETSGRGFAAFAGRMH